MHKRFYQMYKRFYHLYNYRFYSHSRFFYKYKIPKIIIFLPIAFFSTGDSAKRLFIQLTNASCSNIKFDSEEVSEDSEFVIWKADILFNENNFNILLQYLEGFEDCGDPDIIWRLSRACFKVATLSSTENDRAKILSFKAYELAKRATILQPDNFASQKWAGITLSHIGSYESLTEKISHAYEVKNYFDKAIKLFPNDPTSWHLLGQWCFTIACISWLQRRVISTILATPPTSSFEEALHCFQQAEAIEPGFYSVNALFLGKTFLKINNTNEARIWLNRLLNYEANNEEDQKAIEEAKLLLGNIAVE